MSLTGKQRAFVELKAAGVRNEEAAKRAGYSANSAAVTATGLMKRADIKEAIAALANNDDSPVETASSEWSMKPKYDTPLDLLRDVWNNPDAPKTLRYQAAKDALPYCHARKEGGKKDEAAKESKKAAAGKFGSAPKPSHLRAVK